MEQISVIIPVYNAEATLPTTVPAVLGQSYVDIELILVNDGSKDSSGAVCDSFDDRVTFHLGDLLVCTGEWVPCSGHGVTSSRSQGLGTLSEPAVISSFGLGVS